MTFNESMMTEEFYRSLDQIMKQDFGGRGLLASLPASPLKEVAASLKRARRVILLTGFPVRRPDGSVTGETDGPSGTANLAAALTAAGCGVCVVTAGVSYPLLEAALQYRDPKAMLIRLPEKQPEAFIRSFVRDSAPTHLISLERPGKAADGHYHNMRGEIIDDMISDSALFLSEARNAEATVISVGDGGNEMGMGAFRRQVAAGVPFGDFICAEEAADLPLASGVSNWWGWGLSALLSVMSGRFLLPSPEEETRLLARVVSAGGVDGCTKRAELSVDQLPLERHLAVLRAVSELTARELTEKPAARPLAGNRR